MSAVLNEVAGKVVGRTDVFLSGAKTHVRYEETNLAQLSAKADMMAAQRVEPDVVLHLKAAGGVRASIGACILPLVRRTRRRWSASRRQRSPG